MGGFWQTTVEWKQTLTAAEILVKIRSFSRNSLRFFVLNMCALCSSRAQMMNHQNNTKISIGNSHFELDNVNLQYLCSFGAALASSSVWSCFEATSEALDVALVLDVAIVDEDCLTLPPSVTMVACEGYLEMARKHKERHNFDWKLEITGFQTAKKCARDLLFRRDLCCSIFHIVLPMHSKVSCAVYRAGIWLCCSSPLGLACTVFFRASGKYRCLFLAVLSSEPSGE